MRGPSRDRKVDIMVATMTSSASSKQGDRPLPAVDSDRSVQGGSVHSSSSSSGSAKARRQKSVPNAAEFRMLGLKPREARPTAIRRALAKRAKDAQRAEDLPADGNDRLAQFAVAGYRLLDPRRRRTLYERVQLLLWSDDDASGVSGSLLEQTYGHEAAPKKGETAEQANPSDLDDAARVVDNWVVTAKPIEAPTIESDIADFDYAAEEQQVALDVFRSIRSHDRRANALWIGIVALIVSLSAAITLVTQLFI